MEGKKYNAYMSLEMSFIVPLLISLFYVTVLAGIILFSRCINSQNMFIEELRNDRLTLRSGAYGEVIYNELSNERLNPISKMRKER